MFGRLASLKPGGVRTLSSKHAGLHNGDDGEERFKHLLQDLERTYTSCVSEVRNLRAKNQRLSKELGLEQAYLDKMGFATSPASTVGNGGGRSESVRDEPVLQEDRGCRRSENSNSTVNELLTARVADKLEANTVSRHSRSREIVDDAHSDHEPDSCSRRALISEGADREQIYEITAVGEDGLSETDSSSACSSSSERHHAHAPQACQSDESSDNSDEDHVFAEWKNRGKNQAKIESRLEQSRRAQRVSIWRNKGHDDIQLRLWDDSTIFGPEDRCVISPVGLFRFLWDSVSFLILVLQLYLTPFSIAFQTQGLPWIHAFEDVMTAFFMADIILSFNTGIMREVARTEILIMNRADIAREYLAGWFWIDCVATIPFDKMVEGVPTKYISLVRIVRVSRMLKLLRLMRLIRAIRMVKSIKRGFELEMERVRRHFLLPALVICVFGLLAHLHACLWYAMQPEEMDFYGNVYSRYFQALAPILKAYVMGIDIGSAGLPFCDISLFIGMQRVCFIMVINVWLIFQAMLFLEAGAKFELVKAEALSYLNQRKVSHSTQIQVLHQLNEASQTANIKRRFDTWISSDIPPELHRTICEELWKERLSSLGLVKYVFNLHSRMSVEVSLIVREETFAHHNVLFKEGDPAIAAYNVLNGVIHVESSFSDVETPDFINGMWVGEKALVNPALTRTITAVCRTTSTLMVLPAEGFQGLLIDFDLLPLFEDYCVQHLWHGICGRCGRIGDHFANDCPLIKRIKTTFETTTKASNCGYMPLRNDGPDSEVEEAPGLARLLPRGTVASGLKRDLREFLRAQGLQCLKDILENRNVRSLEDVETLLPRDIDEIIDEACDLKEDDGEPPADDLVSLEDGGLKARADTVSLSVQSPALLREALSLRCVREFKAALEDRAKGDLATLEKRSQHLVFLSHHKLDAGTEASLLRQEIESLIHDHPVLRRTIMDTPVFLDSEDLCNLEALQDHVRNSHNVLLLLTGGVLTRPWVLVEIATALRAGVPVLPVEVRKTGNEFRYPDEKFYMELSDGKMLPRSSMQVLASCNVTLMEVEAGIKKVFNRISFPYSPHRPAEFRKAEVYDFLKQCHYQPWSARNKKRGPAMSTHAGKLDRQASAGSMGRQRSASPDNSNKRVSATVNSGRPRLTYSVSTLSSVDPHRV
eukprot:TRINITY_DN80534_c0_g1_i1.p1 TRINITY_DN80534_c0_g1~~TRINITY_DN80534_c0_g1_i1.p1  ORF type:complete len:1161 (+),score=247.60 TRINITY_DN80534_c0_g1_i1:122-3604(+)